ETKFVLDLLASLVQFGFDEETLEMMKIIKKNKLISMQDIWTAFDISKKFPIPELAKACYDIIDDNAGAFLENEFSTGLPLEEVAYYISRDTFAVEEIAIFNFVVKWIN